MTPSFRKIPHYLFHMSPASAWVVLLATLLFLIPVFLDILRGVFSTPAQ